MRQIARHRLAAEISRTAYIRRQAGSGRTRVIVATENPVERYDPRSGDYVREILTMGGISWRSSLRQLPIIDSHNRSTVRNVFGSVRDLRIENRQLVGNLYWARDARSQEVKRKVEQGHLSDFSVTARPLEILQIGRGERYASHQGPADVVIRWQPLDVAIVATGADELAGAMV